MIEEIIIAGIGIGMMGVVWHTLRHSNTFLTKEKKSYITIDKEKERPPFSIILSHMETLSDDKRVWTRSPEEQTDYQCTIDTYTFLLSFEDYQVKVRVKEKGIVWYEFSVYEKQQTMLFIKQREVNGKHSENRRKIETFGTWIEPIKNRYQQEEIRRKQHVDILQERWKSYEEEQEKAYRCVLSAIANVPIIEVRYLSKIFILRMKNDYFKIHIKRKGKYVVYEILFPNDMLLLEASIHVKTGEITCKYPIPYIKGERREKLLDVLHKHADILSGKINNNEEQIPSLDVAKEEIKNRRKISPEEEQLTEQVETLKKQIEWLQEEEILRLETTLGKLLDIEDTLSEAYAEQKSRLQNILQETIDNMEKRKVRELKKRLYIVEKREG